MKDVAETADRIDCDLARLMRRAEEVGLIELSLAIRRARNEAREYMTDEQRKRAPH